MKNSMQNSVKEMMYSLLHVALASVMVLLGAMNVAYAADPCKTIAIPSKHFIYVADAMFQKVQGTTIHLGNITFPIDEKTQASLTKKYFVISSKDLTPNMLTTASGRDMGYFLDPVQHPCKRVNISSVTFDFDSSSLPPGFFQLETPFFGENGNGRGDISAKTSQVEGHISRAWFSASIRPTEKPGAEITLTNSGNAPASAMDFHDVPNDWPLKITENTCQDKTLKPAESCRITMERRADNSTGKANERWPFSYANSKQYACLGLDSKELKIYVSVCR